MSARTPLTIFGKRLRAARLRVGIPQDRLGVQIGLDEGTASARMSRYETGTHEPPYEVAAKIAQALAIPAAYLYCEDDALARMILGWSALDQAGRKRVLELLEVET